MYLIVIGGSCLGASGWEGSRDLRLRLAKQYHDFSVALILILHNGVSTSGIIQDRLELCHLYEHTRAAPWNSYSF